MLVISHDDRYYHVADRIVKLESGKLTRERGSAEACGDAGDDRSAPACPGSHSC